MDLHTIVEPCCTGEMPDGPPNDLLDRFAGLDSAAVSDALESCGLPSGFGGLRPVWGHPTAVGFASTVQLTAVTGEAGMGSHIGTAAVAASGPTDVLVIANAGRVDVSCWGGLLSLGAVIRGIRGVVADGACRDVGEARRLRFPVFARASTPRTARGRLRQVSIGEPVEVCEVTVARGDIVIADGTGIAIVPQDRADEILFAARLLRHREQAIADEVRAGSSLTEAMSDDRLAGNGQVS